MRKMNLWEDAFNKVDSQETAYWLGFSFGGVALRQRGNNHTVSIASHTSENLEDLSEYLDFEGNVRSRREKKGYIIEFASENVFSNLMKYGVPPSKRTLSVCFPELPVKYKRSFIQGYMDNNSNLCIGAKAGELLQIAGPEHFLLPMKDFIEVDFGLKNCKRISKRTVNGACGLKFTNGPVIKIFKRYYEDAEKIRHRNKDLVIKLME